ncbi:TIGR01620 family protein, partial [Mesorhizobium sp. M2C.T.Ca.TU.002.02.1.1]
MTAPRKPAAFRIEPETEAPPHPQRNRGAEEQPMRRPRAARADVATVIPSEIDVFDEPDIEAAIPPPATAPKKSSLLARLFFGALSVLVSLAVGLWADQLIRDLFARAEWLGWLGAGMGAI